MYPSCHNERVGDFDTVQTKCNTELSALKSLRRDDRNADFVRYSSYFNNILHTAKLILSEEVRVTKLKILKEISRPSCA
jgi:hypothetical protein